MNGTTAILADGDFPSHPRPLAALRRAARVVCCDGAALKLRAAGREPDCIVGDLDSLPSAARAGGARVVRDPGQDDNDLSKAFRFCLARGWRDLVLLGCTGLREDHTLANIALLADFAREAPAVRMLTNHGAFLPLLKSGQVRCRRGQAVSLFSPDPAAAVTSDGLQYPLRRLRLARWWTATLNVALGSVFSLRFRGGPVLVYLAYSRKREKGSGARRSKP